MSTKETVTETLCENEWISLRVVRKPDAGVNGYVYSHETRCGGRIVAVLPYRETPDGREYLVKREMTPCWSFDRLRSAVTGGWEGGDIADDAVHEMLEETGYEITADELISLGESFASKSADTVYTLFSVDLTRRLPGEAPGDGMEQPNVAEWVTPAALARVMDPQVHVMYGRLAALHPVAGEPADPPLPEGEFGRVDLPGYRNHTGWVTEETRFGVQVAMVRDWDGHVLAEVAMGPGCQFVHLPTPLKRPERKEPAAITSGPPPAWRDGWDSAEDAAYDDDGPDCGCLPGFTCQECRDAGVF